MERELRRVERSAAFDGVQGRRDAEAVRRRLNRWAGAVDGIARDVRTWRGMKQRLAEREHDLRRMWASSGREAAGEEAMHEIAAIFAALEAKLRRGEQADLRQAAAQIERIIEQAAVLLRKVCRLLALFPFASAASGTSAAEAAAASA